MLLDGERPLPAHVWRAPGLTGLFGGGPEYCAVCKRELGHKHKPKREWNIRGKLCGDCHVDKTKEFYEATVRQPCKVCGTTRKISDMWEPRWQWDMDGLLCKECFDKKESEFDQKRNYCSLCGAKMGLIRYNPKPKWKSSGQMCRACWDDKKAEMG